jgi:8-oxo-dGTP pyrophosphatase MutT (NUDIX family)
MATFIQHTKRASPTAESKENNKRTKHTNIPTPPHPVNGVSNTILSPDNKETFVLEGDRHHWPGATKADWATHFRVGVPSQIYTVEDILDFQGKQYGPIEQARFILMHMITKGWAPTCCCDEHTAKKAAELAKKKKTPEAKAAAKAADALALESARAVTPDQLKALHALLMDFTARVKDHHYIEMVMGGVDGGPTTDIDTVIATAQKETMEEAGIDVTSEALTFVGWAEPYTSRKSGETTTTAMFVTYKEKTAMEQSWADTEAQRRPKGKKTWRCPHAWYKVIPGIDMDAAAHEKAIHETRNGHWITLDEAEKIMDSKNVKVLRQVRNMMGI